MSLIWITFNRVGFHCWPDAATLNPERAYLSSKHRHLFQVKVTVPVLHDDRDIEFHDLRDYAESWWPRDNQLLSLSCEAIARAIGLHIKNKWPHLRFIEVSVSEDGECGGIVTIEGSKNAIQD